jgi:hypothetical protein
MAQWVSSLDLTTHTSLLPIRRGFPPGFVNYKKGALDSQSQVIKFTSCLSLSVVLSGFLHHYKWLPWHSWHNTYKSVHYSAKVWYIIYLQIMSSRQTVRFDWLTDFWCFNANFNNISAISWQPLVVVEEAGENHRPRQATGKLYHLWLRVKCTLFVIYRARREPTPDW